VSSQSSSTFASVQGTLFDGPGMVARDTLLPRVAREDDVPLVRATSIQETLQNTAQFVGPLAAGFLIATVAEQGTLLVAWVAVYVPLRTLVFPAWFNLPARAPAPSGCSLAPRPSGPSWAAWSSPRLIDAPGR
jgi:hypothetical protein